MKLYDYCEETGLDELLQEYDASNELSSTEIGAKSTKLVSWTCQYGHTEIESPYNRVRRGYCSICGRKRQGSLAQSHPELLPYWSKNNSVNPAYIAPTSPLEVEWKCSKGHIWRMPINKQVLSRTICSECNSFFSVHPELRAEWDEDKNRQPPPSKMSLNQNSKVWWKCSKGHGFFLSPAERHRGRSCPVCPSLGFQRPDLANEWHPTKNGVITPYDVLCHSKKRAWFRCPICGTDYESCIQDRYLRKSENCPQCNPRRK